MSKQEDNENFVKFIQDRLGLKIDGWAGKVTRDKIEPLLPQVDVSNSYSQRFLNIMPWLYKWEGKTFENDLQDPGGATKFGIDHRSHPDLNIKGLAESQATDIYWNEYWQKNRCESYAFPLGEVYFNACVNCGASQADKFLQRSNNLWTVFLQEHEQFYRNLAESKPTLKKFLSGWLNRTHDLKAWIDI